MYPILFQWNSIIIPSWHAFLCVAVITLWQSSLMTRRYFLPNLSVKTMERICAYGYVWGYLGARSLSIFVEEPPLLHLGDFWNRMTSLGAMTFYGGFLGVISFGFIYSCWKKIRFSDFFDVFAPSCFLALAIGRVGCFLNGDDYGVIWNEQPTPWWVVAFPFDNKPRIPIQLIESLSAMLLALLLWVNFSKLRKFFGAGTVGLCGSLTYAVLRFLLEYWRGDERGWVLTPDLSTSQFISLGVVLFCLYFVFKQLGNYMQFRREERKHSWYMGS